MYQANQGQIEFIRKGIKQNVRGDGRKNNEIREFEIAKGVLPTTNGSSYIQIFDSQASVYVGIKGEIIDTKSESEGEIKIQIDSAKRRQDKDKDDLCIQTMNSILEELFIKNIKKDKLLLVKKQKCLRLYIDIFLIDYINFAYLEIFVRAVRAALEDLQLPEIQITHNFLTEQDDIVLKEENMYKLDLKKDLQLPLFFLVGEMESVFLIDLTVEEFQSLDNVYFVAVSPETKILAIEKQGAGYISPENIFRIQSFITSAAEYYLKLNQ